ncbi:TBC1 domain family member 13-like [Styela clava]|uniref:TBC1 domain family member 13-like n=1 Tax=Styela clava TaxID=7725 RepID=UPI00193A11B8|nr:TBC1 domain family member 13-like [Styela clava]
MADKRRENEFLEILGASVINIKQLGKLSSYGISDTCGIRPLAWRILLKYLPAKRDSWASVLDENRKIYKQFVNEMIIKPGLKEYCTERTDVTMDDHPLNPNPKSEWNSYFKDNDILLQIDKDVRRLCPDISFFQNASNYPCEDLVNPINRVEVLHKRVQRTALSSQNVAKNRSGIVSGLISKKKQALEEYAVLPEGSEAHWEVVERILFIYAKLNPGTGYVQGMNEIIGPLFYTFASDPNKDWAEHAECDTFFCFTNLMSEIRDNFIKTLDHSMTGIGGTMDKVSNLVKTCDPKVWLRLDSQSIREEFYLFRWITLLLSQEFSLPDTIRLWDSLFSDPLRFDLLVAVCGGMIILLRDQLLTGDFSSNMKMLQNFPDSVEMEVIIAKAHEIKSYVNLAYLQK